MANELTCFPGFCLQCSEVLRQCVTFQHDLPKGQAAHHADNTTFHLAVDSDCDICLRIQSGLWTDRPFVSSAWESQRHDDNGHIEVTFIVNYKGMALIPSGASKVTQGLWQVVIADITEDTEVLACALAARSQDFTGAPKVKDLASCWLRTCLVNHTDCNERSRTPWYPTRLLDVSSDRVRLIETNDAAPTGHYATMSHCWGHESFVRLTGSTYETFRQGLSEEDIAQSFKDIIDLTRHLGIQYLWIDSFCILQDSNEDWRTESAQMCKVYSNAVVNLGVIHAPSPLHGCYSERRSEPHHPRIIHVPTADMSAPRIAQVYDPVDRHADPEPVTLFRRAWFYQERFLAQRMLHFAGDRIYWECSHAGHYFATEACPLGTVCPPYPFGTRWSTTFILPPYKGFMPIDTQQEAWSSIVEAYSKLELTYPDEDKLLALAGIGQALSTYWQDDYAYGFFRRMLVKQLAWYAVDGKRSQALWRAPSWSWASINGQVVLPTSSDELPLLSIVRNEPQDDAREKQYRASGIGKLQLKGHFIPLTDVKGRYQLDQDDEGTDQHIHESQALLLASMDHEASYEERSQTSPLPCRMVNVKCIVLVQVGVQTFKRIGRLSAYTADDNLKMILATEQVDVSLV